MERKDYIALLIGLTSAIKLRIVGTFYASEILLIALYFVADVWLYKQNKTVRKLMILSLVWLVGICVSDYFNHTERTLFLKGFVGTLILIFEMPIVYWILSDKPFRYFYYLLGAGIVSVPCYLLFGNPNDVNYETDITIWLFYSMIPLAHAVIGWMSNRGVNNMIIYFLIVIFALFFLIKGCRNIFLSFLLALFFLIFINKILKTVPEEYIFQSYQHKWIRLVIFLVVGALLIGKSYGYLAINGYLGEDGRNKYLVQKSQKNGIMSGRDNTIMGVSAALERPILGYGSYPMDKDDAFYSKYVADHGLEYIPSSSTRHMPGHSHIIGTWVQWGVFGGIFWLYVLYIMLHFIKRGAILKEQSLIPIVSLVYFGWVWDIGFSPFWDRVGVSFFIMYMILQLSDNYTES